MQVSSKPCGIRTENGTDPKRPLIRATNQATAILVMAETKAAIDMWQLTSNTCIYQRNINYLR